MDYTELEVALGPLDAQKGRDSLNDNNYNISLKW